MALDIKKFIARFVEEARDHVARLGDGLDALEREAKDEAVAATRDARRAFFMVGPFSTSASMCLGDGPPCSRFVPTQ